MLQTESRDTFSNRFLPSQGEHEIQPRRVSGVATAPRNGKKVRMEDGPTVTAIFRGRIS